MRSYRSHDGKDQGLREGRADACSLGYGVAASTTKIHGPVGTASLETYHSIWCEPGVENLGGSGLQHTEIPESNLSQNWLTQCEIWGSGRDIKTYFGFFFYILKKSPHFKRFGGGFSANRRAEKLVFLNQVNEICDFRYIHMTPRAGALRKKEKKKTKNLTKHYEVCHHQLPGRSWSRPSLVPSLPAADTSSSHPADTWSRTGSATVEKLQPEIREDVMAKGLGDGDPADTWGRATEVSNDPRGGQRATHMA